MNKLFFLAGFVAVLFSSSAMASRTVFVPIVPTFDGYLNLTIVNPSEVTQNVKVNVLGIGDFKLNATSADGIGYRSETGSTFRTPWDCIGGKVGQRDSCAIRKEYATLQKGSALTVSLKIKCTYAYCARTHPNSGAFVQIDVSGPQGFLVATAALRKDAQLADEGHYIPVNGGNPF